MNPKKEAGTFSIKRIKDFSFYVNEFLFEQNKEVRIQIQHYTGFDIKTNLVSLTVKVYYSYNKENATEDVLVSSEVENIFEVNELDQYLVNEDFILPENLIVSMVSIALSHTRALMAKNISGTLFQDNILPLVNPKDVAMAFYPQIFPPK